MRILADIRQLRSLSVYRLWNILKVHSSIFATQLFGKYYLWGKPYILTIEPTNRCNLYCEQCVTGRGAIERVSRDLDFGAFKKIIDDLKRELCYIVLFNQGEPFLNDDLIRFIRYAKQHNIYVITSTNGHFLHPAKCKQLIQSALDAIIVSLDGVDADTYYRYRRGGNFQTVMDGIKNLVAVRTAVQAAAPKIYIQFLVMKHNQHQINGIQALAKKLRVDKLLLKTVQIESFSNGQQFLPSNEKLSRYHYQSGQPRVKKSMRGICKRLWNSATILSDGSVVPCCFDKNGHFIFGNIQHHTFTEIWSTKRYEKFRRRFIVRSNKQPDISICQNCTRQQKVYL